MRTKVLNMCKINNKDTKTTPVPHHFSGEKTQRDADVLNKVP